MHIRTVQTRKDLAKFIEVPYRFHRPDPVWVAPLRSYQWNQFDKKRNPMLDHCEYVLFLLEDGPQIIGRISAFVDRLAVDWWKEPIGLFGSYECIADPEASRLLLTAAQEWLTRRRAKAQPGA